jgi:hypothetical protein
MRKIEILSLLAGAATVAFASTSHALTQDWPPGGGAATPPYSHSFPVNDSPYGSVTFTATLTTTYAENTITYSSPGASYTDGVSVNCVLPSNVNSNSAANAGTIVYCPFFVGTVTQGLGYLTVSP